MVARSFRIAFALGLLLVLSACSLSGENRIRRPLVYYVRDVTVMADASVPYDLIKGIDRRVAAAIASTRPPADAERVVLLVKIDKFGTGLNARRYFEQVRFTVTAASIEIGEPVAAGTFTVNSPTNDPRFGREPLAEEIAARIRFAFSLTVPRIRTVRPPKTMSTRFASDPAPAVAAAVTPPPLRTAAPVAAATPTPVVDAVPVPLPAEIVAPVIVAPVVQPPKAKARNAPAQGGPVEQGARGSVRLDGQCDPVTDAECLAP
ncbi:hypothetical protein [Rhizobium sp. CECT 9324]|uniref:hypothetical protein n=1 Tax=Rhizobium sp. CECT 9324 TaxID=2845820 RepID=UPI001E4264EA|nr:hypothetical protein [Rhizobium sp. CECT 9324]CAH0341036.1 hypothetical protein RHI9324_02720 [Rhizobium sp. CECT 9324]